MASEPTTIRDRDFEAELERDDSQRATRVRLAGNADAAIVGQLQKIVDDVHEAMLASHGLQVRVDIRELEFMNATCFNVLVTWVNVINDLAPDLRYQLHFATNTAIPWQRRSLRTLSCFATDLVVVET